MGRDHSCAVVLGGVQCWGLNYFGQLGNGGGADSATPVQVFGPGRDASVVAAGSYYNCATVSGGVQCWGDSFFARFGTTMTFAERLPQQTIAVGSGVTAVAAGYAHSCAVVSGGVVCWGGNTHGQTADPFNKPTNVPVSTLLAGPPILNINNSDPGTRYDAATDGVLLVRYLLGYRGTALVADALGTGASVRDAAQITAHINTYLTRLDVDGDGQTLALTDGVMILRRLLGMNGSALTANAKQSGRSDIHVQAAIDALKP